jgi:catechol 2,3-dioxygenase-like lactoylglutathione lyase family enzyme
MLRHVGVNVRDLAQAKAYYDILMPLLGFEPHITAEDQFAYRPINNEPGASLFFYPALEQSPYSRHQPGLQHLAFIVESRAAVHAAHTKAIELGSEVVHPPGFPPVSSLLLRYILARPGRFHAGGGLPAGGRGHLEHTEVWRSRVHADQAD